MSSVGPNRGRARGRRGRGGRAGRVLDGAGRGRGGGVRRRGSGEAQEGRRKSARVAGKAAADTDAPQGHGAEDGAENQGRARGANPLILPPAEDDVRAAAERDKALCARIDAALARCRAGAHVTTALLRDIRAALRARSVPRAVVAFPRAPTLLLYASREPRVLLDPDAAQLLCECILLFARGNVGPCEEGGDPREGFLRTANEPEAVNVMQRARSWALKVLKGLLHGEGARKAVESSGSGVSSCPQDELNAAAVAWLCSVLKRRLKCMSVAGDDACAAIHAVFLELSYLLAIPECKMDESDLLPVIDAALVAAGEVPVCVDARQPMSVVPESFQAALFGAQGLQYESKVVSAGCHLSETAFGRSGQRDVDKRIDGVKEQVGAEIGTAQDRKRESADAMDEISFARTRGFDANPAVFDRLSSEARATCLRLFPELWHSHVSHLRNSLFRQSTWVVLSHDEEGLALMPVGHAIALDVNLHWQSIDGLWKEILSEAEPFSVRHWEDRRFFRALNFAAAREINRIRSGPTVDGSTLLLASPMYRRFDVAMRPLLSVLETQGSGIEPGFQPLFAVHAAMEHISLDAAQSVSAGDRTEYRAIALPVAAHVVLLAMESHFQRVLMSAATALCWPELHAATALNRSHANGSLENRIGDCRREGRREADSLRILARVLCAFDATRECGGPLVETASEWLSRADRLFKTLSGLLCPQELSSASAVEREEVNRAWRSLNIDVSLWATLVVGHGNCGPSSFAAEVGGPAEVLRLCEMASKFAKRRPAATPVFKRVFDSAMESLTKVVSDGSTSAEAMSALRDKLDCRRRAWLDAVQ